MTTTDRSGTHATPRKKGIPMRKIFIATALAATALAIALGLPAEASQTAIKYAAIRY